MTTEIIALKLASGEDVITRLTEELETVFLTEYPAFLQIHQTEDGRSGVGIAPFAPTSADGNVKIYKSGIVGKWVPDTKLAEEYEKIFFPGKIQLVNAPGKIIL